MAEVEIYGYEATEKQMVVKSNEFIRQKRYDLTLAQQKVIAYIIAKIKPTDTELMPQTISIAEFCKLCGNSTADYTFVREVVTSLYKNCFWYDDSDAKKMSLYTWVDPDITINYGEGTITLKLADKLAPYLISLKQNYTQYQLSNVLSLKSKYGVRLYELLKSYQNIGDNAVISVQKLRSILMCENTYPEYKRFNQHVISRAVDDINKNTDLNILYYPQKKGRSILALEFVILQKK